MPVTIDEILKDSALREAHREIRRGMRQLHLPHGYLIKDPTLLGAVDFEFGSLTRLVQARVRNASYRPSPAHVVNAAKSAGLTRPLTYLHHADAILLRTLCKRAQEQLLAGFPKWVSFGREDKKDGKATPLGSDDYDGWFVKWLRYMKMVSVVVGDFREFLAISDVSNFFPSVDLALLRDRLKATNSLDDEATDLLFFIIDACRPFRLMGTRAPLGLPQDPYDASRILAHYFLKPIDWQLQAEGQQGRYTRWVDDLAVSVENMLEGQEVIGRIQRALSEINLAPNAAKTRIITKQEFRDDHHEQDNDLLDIIHNLTESSPPSVMLKAIFGKRLRDFLKGPRRTYWYRVLRRYYTRSRRVGSSVLGKSARRHIAEFPTEAAHIFDYLSLHPKPLDVPWIIFDCFRAEGRLYDDVQIFGYEALLTVPLPDDQIVRWDIARLAYQHLSGRAGFRRPSGYVMGLIALVLYKFGGPAAMNLLRGTARSLAEQDAMFARHAFIPMYAVPSLKTEALSAFGDLDDPVVNQAVRFSLALERGDDRAIGIALGILQPRESSSPARLLVQARGLPLIPLAKSSPERSHTSTKYSRQLGHHW